MDITIIGMGYVGTVTAACLAEKGHNVFGVDISESKVKLINSGVSPIVEKGLDDLIKSGVENNRIIAKNGLSDAVAKSEIAMICVGTPNLKDGSLDMSTILEVAKQIGLAIKDTDHFITVTIRSTVMPGTNQLVQKLIAQESGKKNKLDFAVVSNPEFLREGSAINDFFHPPYTVIASESKKGIEVIKKLFSFINSPVHEVDIAIAELIKFLNNSFHALKVAFANEVGRIGKNLGLNSIDLMKLFVSDEILNISSRYFMPGFSYGGSCLPKDLKALNAIAKDNELQVPIFNSVEISNVQHLDFILKQIEIDGKNNIGVVGLAFKPGTDDMRHSPSVSLCEKLLESSYEVCVYDQNVTLSKLMGKNQSFLNQHLPHIEKILKDDMDEFLRSSETLVIVHNDQQIVDLLIQKYRDKKIIDVVGIDALKICPNYQGLCW